MVSVYFFYVQGIDCLYPLENVEHEDYGNDVYKHTNASYLLLMQLKRLYFVSRALALHHKDELVRSNCFLTLGFRGDSVFAKL